MPTIPLNRNMAVPKQVYTQQEVTAFVPQLNAYQQVKPDLQFGLPVQNMQNQSCANSEVQTFKIDGMINNSLYNEKQFNPELMPDPNSYRLNQRRKAIRKPSLERQGGFEQIDENFAAENRRKSTMDQQGQLAAVSMPSEVVSKPSVPYHVNSTSNNNAYINGLPSFVNTANVRVDDSLKQDSFESYTNSAIPELEMDISDVYFQNVPEQTCKNVEPAQSMSNFQHQQPAAPKQAPHAVQSQAPHAHLQSQDTLSSDIVNLNYDNSQEWSTAEQQEELYLNEKYVENWNRRLAQFENDKAPSMPVQDANAFNANGQTAYNNFIPPEMPNLWSNTSQKSIQLDNTFKENDNKGNFAFVEAQNSKVEFTPPSIIISNSDYNERQPSSGAQFDNQIVNSEIPILTLDNSKAADSFGMSMINSQSNDVNSKQNNFTSNSNIFEVQPQIQPLEEPSSNNIFATVKPSLKESSDLSQINDSANVTALMGGAMKANEKPVGFETKSVKFSEQIEKKSPPHLDSSFFGDGQLVVQTNTEGMSRARVRWISAFNKINSHLSEVYFRPSFHSLLLTYNFLVSLVFNKTIDKQQ